MSETTHVQNSEIITSRLGIPMNSPELWDVLPKWSFLFNAVIYCCFHKSFSIENPLFSICSAILDVSSLTAKLPKVRNERIPFSHEKLKIKARETVFLKVLQACIVFG